MTLSFASIYETYSCLDNDNKKIILVMCNSGVFAIGKSKFYHNILTSQRGVSGPFLLQAKPPLTKQNHKKVEKDKISLRLLELQCAPILLKVLLLKYQNIKQTNNDNKKMPPTVLNITYGTSALTIPQLCSRTPFM